jgi:hypothetical protein
VLEGIPKITQALTRLYSTGSVRVAGCKSYFRFQMLEKGETDSVRVRLWSSNVLMSCGMNKRSAFDKELDTA